MLIANRWCPIAELRDLVEGPPSKILTDDNFDPHQVEISNYVFTKKGVIIAAEMGLGKAQPLDSMVQTPHGPKRIGSLTLGDEIFGLDGEVHQVTGVHPQGVQETYRVLFRDGSSTECNEQHLWAARAGSARSRDFHVYTLAEMVARGISRQTKSGVNNRWEVPVTAPLKYPKKKLPIDPYVFGVLLGDGCLRRNICVTTNIHDVYIQERVRESLTLTSDRRKNDTVYVQRVSSPTIKPALQKLGVLGQLAAEKHIPEIYRYASVSQRKALLAGLLDTDGHVSTRGSVSFFSSSKTLRDQVIQLVQSLGGIAIPGEHRRTKTSTLEYRCSVKTTFNPVRTPRKSARWTRPSRQCRVQKRISGVEYVGLKKQVCISVSAPDRLYLTDHCIVTHNTASVLHGALRCLQAGKVKRWLIVAPKKVAEDTWPDEFWKWAFGRATTFSPILGTAEERKAALTSPAPFHIINRENLPWLNEQFEVWPYDGVIDDECSRRKGGQEKSAKVKKVRVVTEEDGTKREEGYISGGNISEFGVLAAARRGGHLKRYVGLTGTPAPNGLIDLWGQMYLVDLGRRLGTELEGYKRRWFWESPYGDRKIEPHAHSEGEITDRLKDAMFVYREEDHVDLPPLVQQIHWVNLPPDALAAYKELQKEYCLEEIDVEAVNNGVLANKLLQVANGSVYDTERTSHRLHDRKLQELEKIFHDAAGRPLLVAYSFQFDRDAILKKFGKKAAVFGDRPDDLKRWNAGKIPLMLVHPASAGHGMNFQFGTNIMVWYGLTWSLELYQQFNKRIHRRGQTSEHVYQKIIVARNTYDERQLTALNTKGATQHRITEAFNVMRNIVEKAHG